MLTAKRFYLFVCAYPVIDRPDWTTGLLTHSGLCDFKMEDDLLKRHPHEHSLKLINQFQYKYLMK